jgi:membrane protease YdiL (CAAX protease family)
MFRSFVNIAIALLVSMLVIPLGFQLSLYMLPEEGNGPEFIYSCIFSPLWEEALYRWAPIEASRRLGVLEKVKWPLLVTTSILFGLTHGSTLNIPVQGVFGLILSILYIENKFSYISVVILHMLWNILIFAQIIGNG